jgi:hypothetical protein
MNVFRATVILMTLATAAAMAAEPDLSTPQAALKSFQQAVATQDADAILQTLCADGDAEQKLAKAFADVLVAGKKLNEAAKAKFGTTGQSVGTGAAAGDVLGGLEKAPIVVDGNTATLSASSVPSRAIHLKKSPGGKWQLVVKDFANPSDADLVAQAAVLTKVATVFSDVAGQIQADKFGGPQDAESVIQSRLATVLIQASRAAAMKAEGTTRPGTKR